MLPTITIRKISSYIIKSNSLDQGKTTIEGSRPANVLYLHASLSILGKKGLGCLLENSIKITKYMSNLLESYPQFEIISKPVSNILTYRYLPTWLQLKESYINNKDNKIIDYINKELQSLQKKKGKGFVSLTTIKTYKYPNTEDGIAVLRVVIANPLVTEENIKKVIHEQIDLGKEIEKKYRKFNKVKN